MSTSRAAREKHPRSGDMENLLNIVLMVLITIGVAVFVTRMASKM